MRKRVPFTLLTSVILDVRSPRRAPKGFAIFAKLDIHLCPSRAFPDCTACKLAQSFRCCGSRLWRSEPCDRYENQVPKASYNKSRCDRDPEQQAGARMIGAHFALTPCLCGIQCARRP